MTERWLFAAVEVPPPRLRRLLDWCVAHGADEFTLDVMALADVPAPLADAFEDALEPWLRPAAVRPVLDGADGPSFPSRVRLWTLNASTLPLLHRYLPHASLRPGTPEPSEHGWFENLTVYRAGELLFAALTNEGLGVLQLRPAERDELETLGIVLRS